jgi:hypothetical protein
MSPIFRSQFCLHIVPVRWPSGTRSIVTLLTVLLVTSATALAQGGSPFDTGFTAIQTLFTGTVAKVGFRNRARTSVQVTGKFFPARM